MTARTRSLVSARTLASWLITRETVLMDTPAFSATSWIVTDPDPPCMALCALCFALFTAIDNVIYTLLKICLFAKRTIHARQFGVSNGGFGVRENVRQRQFRPGPPEGHGGHRRLQFGSCHGLWRRRSDE